MKDTGKKKASAGGFSMDPDAQIVGGGLFGAGPGTRAISHRFGVFKYPGTDKKAPALLVEFERDGETHTESYTVGGNNWKPSADGKTIVPRAGQTGFSTSSKAGMYLAALRDECGMPAGFVVDDISVLDDILGTVDRKPTEGVKEKGGTAAGKPGSILIYTEVDEAPWEAGAKKKKKKAKPVDDDDDDDEDAEADDESESDDDDDDAEETPAAKKKAAAAKKKKKAAAAADDDDAEADDDAADHDSDDDDDEDLTEEATEALITALDDGALKLSKVEGAVSAALKKHPQKAAIAALAASPKFLKMEKGWSFDAAKKTVTLD